jgi:glutamyl-Q tRNA(Asp) synthetase
VSARSADARSPVAPARYRGRFAPSPTGPLHFGSLVAALASYCDARAVGGEWLLRIEDVDQPRSRVGAEAQILAALERYGFAWDGRITRQSDRASLYEEALARLRETGHAYECACTRRELEAAPLGATGERVYPGTCRNGVPPSRAGRRQRAWRVRVADNVLTCNDRLQGAQRQALAHDVGDFVVKRADGLFAYQLAVVVDDAAQGVTDVVRGADLLSSTPRQVLLQNLLGVTTPSYLHVPVAINASGEKLSKQTRAAALPDAPLPMLLAAWRFLGQEPPPCTPANVAEFWRWAHAAWKVSRLPPVPMLPAPAGTEDAKAARGNG